VGRDILYLNVKKPYRCRVGGESKKDLGCKRQLSMLAGALGEGRACVVRADEAPTVVLIRKFFWLDFDYESQPTSSIGTSRKRPIMRAWAGAKTPLRCGAG
jgi:hypothetical protein